MLHTLHTPLHTATRPSGWLPRLWASGAAIALQAPTLLRGQSRQASRTGGPDDDEDDELRRLMPILAAVIAIAVIFSG